MGTADRLSGGAFPRRTGDLPAASSALLGAAPSRPGDMVTPAGFIAPIPNRSAACARGLNPRNGTSR